MVIRTLYNWNNLFASIIDRKIRRIQISRHCQPCKALTFNRGSRNGAVVRELSSRQCGPGLIPELGAMCGLSLLLVLVLATRGFSSNSNSIWIVVKHFIISH